MRTLVLSLLLPVLLTWASSDVWCGDERRADATSSAVEISVDNGFPPIELAGRVLDTSGQSAARSIVTVQTMSVADGTWQQTLIATGSDGTFRFRIRMDPKQIRNLAMAAESQDGSQMASFGVPGTDTDTDTGTDNPSFPSIEVRLVPVRVAQVRVINGDGTPVAGAQTAMELSQPSIPVSGVTDASGQARLRFPSTQHVKSVVAWKESLGLDYRLYQLSRGERAAGTNKPPEFPETNEVTLTLTGARPLSIRVVDDQQQPVAGARIYPWLLNKDIENNHLNLSQYRGQFQVNSDANGMATIPWLPAWQQTPVEIWSKWPGFVQTRTTYDPKTSAGSLAVSMSRLVPIRGTVRDADGRPVGGITIAASGAGYGPDSARETAVTDDTGTYELIVEPNQIYLLLSLHNKLASAPHTGFAVLPNTPVAGRDFTLRPATRVHGILRDESSQQPLTNQRVLVYQHGTALSDLKENLLPNPEGSRRSVRPRWTHSTRTDDSGRFEFLLGDGNFEIWPHGKGEASQFVIAGESEREINITTRVERFVELTGRVLDAATGNPLAGAPVSGLHGILPSGEWKTTTGPSGEFRVRRQERATSVHAISEDGRLAEIAELEPAQASVSLALRPVAEVHGRLLHPETSEPWGGQYIQWGTRIPSDYGQTFGSRFGGRVTTAADGTFRLPGLVAGREYTLQLDSRSGGLFLQLSLITLSPGESFNAGDLKPPQLPRPYVPPTLEERIRQAFDVTGTPRERHAKALEQVAFVNQHLLIVFGNPSDPRVHRLMEIRFSDKDFRTLSDEFHVMAIPTDDSRIGAARDLAVQLEEPLSGDRETLMVVLLNAEGKKVATWDSSVLCRDNQFSKDAWLEQLRRQLPERVDARRLLEDTLAQAKADSKRVLIQQTATSCDTCQMLSRFLRSSRSIWEKDYIWLTMDSRYSGARELMTEMRKGARGGIPWFAILDDKGTVLATSNHLTSLDNIGFPSEQSGQRHFEAMLHATRQRMTSDDVAQLIEQLAAPHR